VEGTSSRHQRLIPRVNLGLTAPTALRSTIAKLLLAGPAFEKSLAVTDGWSFRYCGSGLFQAVTMSLCRGGANLDSKKIQTPNIATIIPSRGNKRTKRQTITIIIGLHDSA
jgi:hypothetical protein